MKGTEFIKERSADNKNAFGGAHKKWRKSGLSMLSRQGENPSQIHRDIGVRITGFTDTILALQIGLQVYFQTFPGTEEKAFHRREAHPKNDRNLIIGHFLILTEHKGESFFFRKK